MSNFDDIFNAPKINTSKLVLVFESDDAWKVDIYCKPCPKRSYGFWIADIVKLENLKKGEELNHIGFITELMAKLACLCACDESGQMIFSYNTDVEKLIALEDTTIIETLFRGACQANGIEKLAITISKTFAEFDKLFSELGDGPKGVAKTPVKKPKKPRKSRAKNPRK